MNFYDSIIEAARKHKLTVQERGQLYVAAIEYLYDRTEPDFQMSKAAGVVFDSMRPVFDKQIYRQEAGARGGKAKAERMAKAKQAPSKSLASEKQTPSEQEQEQEVVVTSTDVDVCRAGARRGPTVAEVGEAVEETVAYLNERTGKRFSAASKATRSQIRQRMQEGFGVEDFKRVIDNMCEQWGGAVTRDGVSMEDYLRPSTLFRPSNFEGYLNAGTRLDAKAPPRAPVTGSAEGDAALRERLGIA